MKNINGKSVKFYSFDASDKKLEFYVNLSAVLIGIAMILIGNQIVPIKELYNVSGLTRFLWRSAALLLCMSACLVLNELIHILAFRCFIGEYLETGIDKIYPYVGCKTGIDKKNYVRISLAPILIIGMILIALLFVVPKSWFWLVYITLTMHVSGAVGELYCISHIILDKNGIKIRDNGKAIEILQK